MPENEITCIFFEIDKGMSTSNQFRCEIERPFTNLNDISTKLAGKTYIKENILPIFLNNFINILAKTIKYKESFKSNISKAICPIWLKFEN